MRSIIDQSLCAACGSCHANCPQHAITRRGAEFHVTALCAGCGTCRQYCATGAMTKGPEAIEFASGNVTASLKALLNLTRPVVAMKYASAPPEGMTVEPGPTFWCAVCGEVLGGETAPVYFTKEASLCGGASMFGLGSRRGITREEMLEALEAAQVIGQGNHYLTLHEMTKARDCFPSAPRLHNGLVIGPLEAVKMPDMILFPANANQICVISTAFTFDTGNVIRGTIGSAACIVNASAVLFENRPTFTSGDHGARMFMGLDDSEMLVSFPYKIVPGLIKNLEITASARANLEGGVY